MFVLVVKDPYAYDLCRSTIRDKIIPHAVSWFTGEAAQDEDYIDLEDDEDEDDEDEDEEDEEEEDEDEDDDDEDEHVTKTKKKVIELLVTRISLLVEMSISTNYFPLFVSIITVICWAQGIIHFFLCLLKFTSSPL